MHETWFYALWILGAYLLGSISTGDLVARAAGVNIRDLGTGNPGAANIYREVGPAYGVVVFALDVTKGAAVTVPLILLGLPAWTKLSAVAALLIAHIFPLLQRFRGGTGMAVAMGTTLGLLPLGVLIAAPASLVTMRLSKNTGYSGGLFFLITLVVGGLLHRDAPGMITVAMAGTGIWIKAFFQYRNV